MNSNSVRGISPAESLGVYAIYDSLVGRYSSLTTDESDDVAIRNFVHAVKSTPNSLLSTHPEHFSLCRVGTFRMKTGVLVDGDAVIKLLSAADVLSGGSV